MLVLFFVLICFCINSARTTGFFSLSLLFLFSLFTLFSLLHFYMILSSSSIVCFVVCFFVPFIFWNLSLRVFSLILYFSPGLFLIFFFSFYTCLYGNFLITNLKFLSFLLPFFPLFFLFFFCISTFCLL